MPNHRLLGKKQNHLNRSPDYDETKVSFEEIATSAKTRQIQQSDSQRELNVEKVQSMIEEYLENPHFLKFKNRIVIGIFNNTWYLVDGQHRLEMARLCWLDHSVQDELVICWYHCNSEDMLRLLFRSLNQDSSGNQYYIQQNVIQQSLIDNFVKYLKRDHHELFHRNSNSSYTFSIQAFRDELIKINYFDSFTTAEECYKDILEKNELFYNLTEYNRELLHNENLDDFYHEDKQKIKAKFIIPCKNCKFIQWLETKDINDCYHYRKKPKLRISKSTRDKCWENEFGNAEYGTCPISNCSNQLCKKGKGGFQAGHVISEKNGGRTEFMNLRPICAKCNQNMAHYNWEDYDSLSHKVM